MREASGRWVSQSGQSGRSGGPRGRVGSGRRGLGRRLGPALSLLAACATGAAGCGAGTPGNGDNGSTLTEAQVDEMRGRCAFPAGALPVETSPRGAPLGGAIPIDTIVVIMMENRSFDHLLSDLPALGQPDAEVATEARSNKDSHGKDVPFHHLVDYCFGDTNHEWAGSHLAWNEGKNDGFVLANEVPAERANPPAVPADGERAMGYYTNAEIPYLHGLATTFAVADHNFASVMGPTWPNRDYLYAGTSLGLVENVILGSKTPTLFSRLDEAGVDWHEYYESLSGTAVLGTFLVAHQDALPTFFTDAASGQLAPVVLIDPDLSERGQGENDDFHPPGDVQLGDQFLDRVVSALMASPQWSRMAVFVTFDEGGGLYDHVPPPPACPPDDRTPIAPATGAFDRYGFRVPLIAISPYARAHHVTHRVYDHTSISRFIEARFRLKALTARDANADPLLDLFDFSAPRFATPPALPRAVVDEHRLDWCKGNFPSTK